MPPRHVVVDGSNIATEGRSSPSLAQLDEAVREFLKEYPDSNVTVVVDATFGHRIDDSEQRAFEEARAASELVSPPAGAIGRGDAFLLRIADKVNAMVLSNDSFQEFHGDYDWLFDPDRLIGGVPVPGIGWIFTPRSPVRGPLSRVSVQKAKKAKKAAETPKVKKAVKAAIDVATEEAEQPAAKTRRRRRGPVGPPSEPVNEPLIFIDFVGNHPLGSQVEGLVDEFTSHGAFVMIDGVRCYLPLTAMGDPPPRSARELMKKGETRTFVVQAFDPPRRGVEIALPAFVHVAGAPTAETVEAEIHATEKPAKRAAKKKAVAKKAAAPVKKAKKEPAKAKATTKKEPAKKKATAKKAAAVKREPAKRAAKAHPRER
ncbi:MAG TPA: hypothetical protein VFB78_11585 [Acidimicrobiales bacterium]|nr:hypothetical protein [Acidimicrobiales bacterium]